MVLSQRERIIGFMTAGVLGLLALDHFAFTPLLERRREVMADTQVKSIQLDRGEQLTRSEPRMKARWNEMLSAGLTSQATQAESQAMRSLHEWAQDAGLKLTVINPDRPRPVEKHHEFLQTTLRAGGTGSMRSISRFLWRAQTSSIPMRVTDLQVSAVKDGTDELLLNVTVSTLSLAPAPAPTKSVARGAVQ